MSEPTYHGGFVLAIAGVFLLTLVGIRAARERDEVRAEVEALRAENCALHVEAITLMQRPDSLAVPEYCRAPLGGS